MKKAIAMLLAVSATMALGVTALADDVAQVADTGSSSSDVSSDNSSSDASSDNSSSDTSSDNTSSDNSSSDASSDNSSSDNSSSSEDETPVGEPSSLVFHSDEDGTVLGEDLLEPGREYRFPAYVEFGGQRAKVAVSDELLKDYKFNYTRVTASGVKTFKIEEIKGVYYLIVETKDTTPTKPIDVKYNVKLVRKSNNISVFTQEVKFSYGYDESNDDYINDLDKGDIVEIDNNRPVITKEQFNKIAKLNDYKNVTLAGAGWQFTVNVTDETTKNMVFTNAGVKEIMAKYPDQDFKFFRFGGKPSFNSTGKVALDVSDIVDDYENLNLYRYANGRVYKLNASYNAADETLEFRTNKLDTFFVTDKAIKDGTVIDENIVSDGNSVNTDKNNPGTGAGDLINAAVMAGIASLAAASAIAANKKSK